MGYGAKEMTRMRLKFVQAFIDSYGTARHYFRRPGFKRVPLPDLPGSPEFMEAYQAAMAGERLVGGIGAKRSVPGTVNAAVAAYYHSLSFTNLAPISRYQRRRILDNFRSEHGDKKIANLRREHIQVLIAAKAEKPGAAHTISPSRGQAGSTAGPKPTSPHLKAGIPSAPRRGWLSGCCSIPPNADPMCSLWEGSTSGTV